MLQTYTFKVTYLLQVESEEEKYIKKLGARITKFRVDQQLSVSDLADGADVSRQQMYRIEAGETNSSAVVLKGIADTLNLTVSELMDF